MFRHIHYGVFRLAIFCVCRCYLKSQLNRGTVRRRPSPAVGNRNCIIVKTLIQQHFNVDSIVEYW
jgi:hypothetical protein